eukprot:gnl/TRDRNA2_/TRDRNA2_150919_c0_seq2.p1 gnl/TRDRNA2_/TRDRNA2_150919_c0~~gnl/TRDRNA2_/TRDRNA2_150919_c0_seq2.p1  ORF type:complete len:332 (-),score=54.07 gnl/TRDRNA2_/TRDRNA2_150919_c0_seq2:119-1114(-)
MCAAPSTTPVAAASPSSSSQTLAEQPLASLVEEDARRRLRKGKVLLRIRLAGNEIASLKEPSPLFSLQPRVAYLPFLYNDVYEHFKSCLPPRMGQSYEIWFDYNDIALKWHYPLGVLCDVLVGAGSVPVPLDLTVHFRGNTSKDGLLPYSGIGDLQRAVMSTFRQAALLQHGSSAPFARLPKQQQTQLWDAISESNLEAYAGAQRQLLCPSLARCKSLSVRLHLYGPPHRVLQQPVPPLEALEQDKEGGEEGSPCSVTPCSVRSFLQRVMPPLLDDSGMALADGVELLTQGLRVPLDAPLYWLALHAAYLDQFVHLVALVPPRLLSTVNSA